MFYFVKEQSPKVMITESYITEVENEYGILFPPLLRQYYLDHNGQSIEPIALKINETTYEVRKMVPLKDSRFSMEQLLHTQRLQDYPVQQMIPIADDRTNGIYYLHTGTGTIYYSQLEGEDDFLPICQGIDCFFQLLNTAYQKCGSKPFDIRSFLGREKKMEHSFLPLGSVVLLQGGTRKVMIITRGMNVNRNGSIFFFDYGGVIYPEGLTGEQMVYFNEDGIIKVYFHGFADSGDDAMQTALNNYLKDHPNINLGTPEQWEIEEA